MRQGNQVAAAMPWQGGHWTDPRPGIATWAVSRRATWVMVCVGLMPCLRMPAMPQIDKSHPIHPRNEEIKKKKLQVGRAGGKGTSCSAHLLAHA